LSKNYFHSPKKTWVFYSTEFNTLFLKPGDHTIMPQSGGE